MKIEDISRIILNHHEGINKLTGVALAYLKIEEKHSEAYAYCQKYSVGAWGSNIWHAILEDAIKLRKELEEVKEKEKVEK